MGIYKTSLDNYKQYPTRFCLPSHLNRLDFSPLYNIDNTELDGLDDLADPSGVIAELETKLAKLFKAPYLHITTNGATGANLAALSHIASRYKKIVIQRDSHISLFRALMLHDIEPVYLPALADTDFIPELNKHAGDAALWLTTPTYDGTTLEQGSIAKYSYIHIDSALGSLFPIYGRHNYLNTAHSITYSGHKGFPALTQTGFLAAKHDMRSMLNIYNSTSPSYILLASIETALEYIEKHKENELEKLAGYREKIIQQCGIHTDNINERYFSDPAKLTIKHVDGMKLYDELLKRKIVIENCGTDFITLFFSILHQDCDIEHFIDSYNDIKLEYPELFTYRDIINRAIKPVIEISPYQANKLPHKQNSLENSAGKLSASMIYLYPPGTPILMPGERITPDIVGFIRFAKSSGYKLVGMNDEDNINVL